MVKTYNLDILLPFHIRDTHLYDAVESCKRALPQNSRIILVNTIDDQKTFEDKLGNVVELNIPNANYISALEFGLAATNSKYVALMNSDDLVDKNRFNKQLEVLSSSQRVLCVTNLAKFFVKPNGKSLNISSMLGKPPNYFHEALLLLGSYRADASWCFDSQWAKSNSLFSSENDISDWSVGMRVMKSTNTVVLSENLYYYRMHSGQVTRSVKETRFDKFYSNWNSLNESLDLRKLTKDEIDMINLIEFSPKTVNLNKILKWLLELEDLLKTNLPKSDHRLVDEILSRRRILICLKNRSFHFTAGDVKFYPKIFFEYIKYKNFLRGNV